MKETKFKHEKIIWDDAGSFGMDRDTSWHTLDEVKEAFGNSQFLVTTYGEVLFETKKDVIMAMSVAHNEQYHADEYSGLFRIPKDMIINRIKIKDYEKLKATHKDI